MPLFAGQVLVLLEVPAKRKQQVCSVDSFEVGNDRFIKREFDCVEQVHCCRGDEDLSTLSRRCDSGCFAHSEPDVVRPAPQNFSCMYSNSESDLNTISGCNRLLDRNTGS